MLAINHFTGPALIVAGPGSGKTTVIVNRIKNLIYQHHVRPENILVITFSKMAAISMQARFYLSVEDAYMPVVFGTFHSVFYNIVKNSYPGRINKIATSYIKNNILLKVLKHISYTDNTEPEFIDSIQKRISYYKNSDKMQDNTRLCSVSDDIFLKIYENYSEVMKLEGIIDFEDMMLLCKELLQSQEGIRKQYQNSFKFILIDEFQDINNLQFEIVKLLLDENKNVFAVGDDDQSIYGFRGANPMIMQDFEKHFPNANIIKLSCNYRSTKSIIDYAKTLIEENKVRYEKDIYTINPKGCDVALLAYETEEEENKSICEKISELITDRKNGNVAILFRNNRSSIKILDLLIKAKIHVYVYEKPFNPYGTGIFRDFMHYYTVSKSLDNIDKAEFVPIMNKPVRYIGRTEIHGNTIDLTLLKGLNQDRDYVVRAINKLEYDLKHMCKMDLFSAFHYFRKVIGYEEYIYKSNSSDSGDSFARIFDYLQNSLRDFRSLEELKSHIELLEEQAEAKPPIEVKDNGVYILTYHASKGLEFDNVFIPKLMEGEVPSGKSVTEEDIEEERRMLYVAMTRAKSNLYMSYIKDDSRSKRLKSRFLYCLLRLKK